MHSIQESNNVRLHQVFLVFVFVCSSFCGASFDFYCISLVFCVQRCFWPLVRFSAFISLLFLFSLFYSCSRSLQIVQRICIQGVISSLVVRPINFCFYSFRFMLALFGLVLFKFMASFHFLAFLLVVFLSSKCYKPFSSIFIQCHCFIRFLLCMCSCNPF